MSVLSDRRESAWLLLGDEPLDVAAAVDFVRDEAAGGIDVFVGTTRRWTGDRETTMLRYEAYGEMALAEMGRLAAEARERWSLVRVAVHHRTGEVEPGASSVVIAVSAAHRVAAFEACRYLIDTLKVEVPIWKREVFRDGTEEWVRPLG